MVLFFFQEKAGKNVFNAAQKALPVIQGYQAVIKTGKK